MKRTTRTVLPAARSREGMALFMIMALMSAFAIIGSGAYLIIKTDIAITSNNVHNAKSFYDAEAGVQYYKSVIDGALLARTLTLDNPVEAVTYTPPAGYTFDNVTALNRISNDGIYLLAVTGHTQRAESAIEITFRRKRKITMGLFGDNIANLSPNLNIYSYHSSTFPNPVPGNAEGAAFIGSNEDVTIIPAASVDGKVLLGKDTFDNQAIFSGPVGTTTENNERFDPDPLGASGGELAADFAYYANAANNNNAVAMPAIVANDLDISGGTTNTLYAGNYYLTNLKVHNNATLRIDASGGPVKIFIDGAVDMDPDCLFTLVGEPADFMIFSNSTSPVMIEMDTDFSGFIYAPFARVDILPDQTFYGAVWADDLYLTTSGEVYLDTTILESLLSKSFEIITWKEGGSKPTAITWDDTGAPGGPT